MDRQKQHLRYQWQYRKTRTKELISNQEHRDTDRQKQVIKQGDTSDLTDHTKRQKNEKINTKAAILDERNDREREQTENKRERHR